MTQWIKCSERLPDDGVKGDFLVWLDNGKTSWPGVYSFDKFAWSHIGVTHWQPLPPPPEDEV